MNFSKALNRNIPKRQRGLKGFLYWWLESKDNTNKLFLDIAINVLILLSVYIAINDLFSDISHPAITLLNDLFLIIFIVEYLARFYISTDFIFDCRKEDGSVFIAIVNKLRWMFKFYSIIDLIAILPAIRYLRIFRTLRLFRLIRALRVLRLLKIFREAEQFILLLRGLREGSSAYWLLIFAIAGFTIIFSFGIFVSEKASSTGVYGNYIDSIWYIVKLIGLGEDTPKTIFGRIFASIMLFCNIAFIGFFISLLTTRMEGVIQNMRKGKIGKVSLKNHIVLCGYTKTTETVILDLLKNKKLKNKIILITLQENPDLSGVIYMNGDFSKPELLKKASISTASMCVIFSEKRDGESDETVDMRTLLTVFHIETDSPEVHSIAEIIDHDNARIIREKINGDEIIFKESIDANIISTCIRHPYISSMIYDLFSMEGKAIEETRLEAIGFKSPVPYSEIKKYAIEQDLNFLGFIKTDSESCLAPSNNALVELDYRLIYVK